MILLERDDDVVPQWNLYGALSQWLCVNVTETAGCANVVARNWLSGRCCERVEFVTVSVEVQSEEFFVVWMRVKRRAHERNLCQASVDAPSAERSERRKSVTSHAERLVRATRADLVMFEVHPVMS